MTDFKLDPLTWERVIENGDYVLISGTEETAQRLKIKLQTGKGEWFDDQLRGFPWLQEVFKKSANLNLLRSRLYQAILSDENVKEVQNLSISVDPASRRATIKFRVVDNLDKIIDFKEFVLNDVRSTTNRD